MLSPHILYDNTFLHQVLSIKDDRSHSRFLSRIFLSLSYTSTWCCLVISHSLVTCYSLVSPNYCLSFISCVLAVIYLNIPDLIPSMLIYKHKDITNGQLLTDPLTHWLSHWLTVCLESLTAGIPTTGLASPDCVLVVYDLQYNSV